MKLNYSDDLEIDLQAFDHDSGIVDTAIQSLEAMSATQDLVMAGDPGLDETTYKIIQHSMEAFMRLGKIGASSPIVPTFESFSGKYDISQATLEGIGEGIKNVFMSIINAIKKALAWVWGLIKRLFGRGKDHDEKQASLEEEAKKHNGQWEKNVPLADPNVLKPLVTSGGLLKAGDFHHLTDLMAKVFKGQAANCGMAFDMRNPVMPLLEIDPIFDLCKDHTLVAKISRNPNDKVHTSMEFGGGEHIFVKFATQEKPATYREKDGVSAKMKFVDSIQMGKVQTAKAPDLHKYTTIPDEWADPDKTLGYARILQKALKDYTEHLKMPQGIAEKTIRDIEADIKKLGVHIFSSGEKKTERDALMVRLKFLKKIMTQPSIMFYAECEKIVTALENVTTHVLAHNKRMGNDRQLRDDKAPDHSTKPTEEKVVEQAEDVTPEQKRITQK